MLLVMVKPTVIFSQEQPNIWMFQTSNLTEKRVKKVRPAVSDDFLEYKCSLDVIKFDILAADASKFNL